MSATVTWRKSRSGHSGSTSSRSRKAKPPSLWRWWATGCGAGAIWLWWLGWRTWTYPATPWLGYCWFATVVVAAGAVWVRCASQRRSAWGDRAVAFWLWHWFTGAPLVIVDRHDMPWWQDLANCWPFLDTVRADNCPTRPDPIDLDDVDPALVDDLEARRRADYLAYWRCRARRAAVGIGRTAATCTLVLAEYVRSGAPHGLGPRALATWGPGATAVAAGFCVAAAWCWMQAAFWEWWIRPLHIALAKRAGHPIDKRPRSWVKLTRSWLGGRRRGWRLKLAGDVDLGDHNKAELVSAVLQKTGLSPLEVDCRFGTIGARSALIVTPVESIPGLVSFIRHEEARRQLFEEATANAPLIGATRGWAPVVRRIDTDSPHILIATKTGHGKTACITAILTSLLWHNRHRRPELRILDPKQHSLPHFERLARVTYGRTLEEIALDLIVLDTAAQQRNSDAIALKAAGKPLDFDPLYIVFEDINTAMRTFNAQGAPRLFKQAKLAWFSLLNLGREVNVHVVACAQRPSAAALGDADAREQFGIIILPHGYSSGTWNMVTDADFVPLEGHEGRAMVIMGTDIVECQLLYVGDAADKAHGDEYRQVRELLEDAIGLAEPASPIGADEHGQEQGRPRGDLDQVSHRSGPAGDLVGTDVDDTRDGAPVTEPQPGGDMPLEVSGMPESELTRPPMFGMPSRAQPVSDISSDLVTPNRVNEPAKDVRSSDHAPIVARYDGPGKGESAGHSTGNGHGPRTRPQDDAAAWLSPGDVPSAPDVGARSPEGPGVIGPEPQPRPNATFRPQSPPQATPSGFSVSRGGMPVVWGDGDGRVRDGTLPQPRSVDLKTAHAEGLIGQGVEYETVVRARSRALEAEAADGIKRWPDPVNPGRTPARYEVDALVLAWRNRPRSDENRKAHDRLNYVIVRGGLRALGGDGVVAKIGHTDNLEERLSTYQDHPNDVVALFHFETTAKSKANERRIHKRLEQYRRPGHPEESLRCYPDRELFWAEGECLDWIRANVMRPEQVGVFYQAVKAKQTQEREAS